MFKLLNLIFLLIILSIDTYAKEINISKEIDSFIQLLIREKSPTIAEYAKYTGECGSESELGFVLNKCQLKGWDINSKLCIDFSKIRCQNLDKEVSLFLMWIRNKFLTAGKQYKICKIQSSDDGFLHEIIEVKIGNNYFKLFHNLNPDIPTGLLIDVIEINGLRISNYKLHPSKLHPSVKISTSCEYKFKQ